MPAKKPGRADLEAARDRTVADVVGPGLRVLFCGINPSLYTTATGYHFARPGNRFWKALHRAGFTESLLQPEQQHRLPDYGLGITNIVARATATAAELGKDELIEGGRALESRLKTYRPSVLAVLGVTAYRAAFAAPKAALGPQPQYVAGVRVWVLPNPSGLNAHYQLEDLVALYGALRQAVR